MRTRTRCFDLDHERYDDQEHPNLCAALETVRNATGCLHQTDELEGMRTPLRYINANCGKPSYLWGRMADGRWLSLDIEDALDALGQPQGQEAYEAAFASPLPRTHNLSYRLRMPVPEGVKSNGPTSTTDHPSVMACLEAIMHTWFPGIAPPRNFVYQIWRSEPVTPEDFAISARWTNSVAAVPLTWEQIETVFGTQHQQMALAASLHAGMIA